MEVCTHSQVGQITSGRPLVNEQPFLDQYDQAYFCTPNQGFLNLGHDHNHLWSFLKNNFLGNIIVRFRWNLRNPQRCLPGLGTLFKPNIEKGYADSSFKFSGQESLPQNVTLLT